MTNSKQVKKSTYWLDEPAVLLSKEEITKIWPTKDMTKNEKGNALTRLLFIISILGYFLTHSIKIIVIGIVTILGMNAIYYYQSRKEGFEGDKPPESEYAGETSLKETREESVKKEKDFGENPDKYTKPEVNNPLMNVMPNEIHENPQRHEAAPSYASSVEDTINEKTKNMIIENLGSKEMADKLFSDYGDGWEFDDSMRNFYPMPNTQIPNDQTAFAEFCYGNMPSCKEGDELACSKHNTRLGQNYGS